MYMQDHTGRDIAANISNLSVDTSGLVKDTTVQTTNSKLDDIKTAINNISSAISPAASNVTYDNATSGLSASNVQAAIDELAGEKQDNLTGGGITSGDLNNFRKTINLWLAGLNNFSNAPISSGYGVLEVIECSPTTTLQRFTQYASSGTNMCRTYVRYYTNNQWYTWIQTY